MTLLVHELSHYAVCRLMDNQIEQLELTPFGGIMTYRRGSIPRKGLKGSIVHAAGPLGNYLFLLYICIPGVQRFIKPQLFHGLIVSNVSMILFNLLPALPLDGGHIVFCLGYYLFPIARLVQILSFLGKLVGIAGCILSAYGLFFRQTLNCSLLIVSVYLIFSAGQSQKALLAENVCTLIHERLTSQVRIRRIEGYQVSSDTPLYELIPYLKTDAHISFFFLENELNRELPEYAFCQNLLSSPSATVKEAYLNHTSYCKKTLVKQENTAFPS